jgi:hypothetical protein
MNIISSRAPIFLTNLRDQLAGRPSLADADVVPGHPGIDNLNSDHPLPRG